MSNAKITGTDQADPNSTGLAGAGARAANIDCCGGQVRLFCSNTTCQHIQDLGGVGYGAKEETSSFAGWRFLQGYVTGPTPAGTVSGLGEGIWDIDWEHRLGTGSNLWPCTGFGSTIWGCPADYGSVGLGPVFTATAKQNRMQTMIP